MSRDDDRHDDVGVSRLGRDRLFAKVFGVLLLASASLFAFCAAYVFSAGVPLLSFGPSTAAFLFSMVGVFVALAGLIVFCVRLRVVDRYGLIVSLPEERFDAPRMLKMNGQFVQGARVRAEVSISDSVGSSRASKFNVLSCGFAFALGASMCTFSAAFGVLCAQAHGNFAEAVQSLFIPSTASSVCMVSAAMVLILVAVCLIRYMVCAADDRRMMVLTDDSRGSYFSDGDVMDIANGLRVGASGITNVRISRSGGASVVSGGVVASLT
ncbi:hypothetical protein [Anaplasma capra]|uniref:hypothetical protein n=1 Tax=Anaplasma capra TaxID=1562740 RepID=UPI0021D5DBE4|nr:hypothetical protein [Anaplasma capra]MCU7611291.1 hypothetical protein [Anaplasma capra]MCU7612720.1 hypothetical protein [Anaplasma capra]